MILSRASNSLLLLVVTALFACACVSSRFAIELVGTEVCIMHVLKMMKH